MVRLAALLQDRDCRIKLPPDEHLARQPQNRLFSMIQTLAVPELLFATAASTMKPFHTLRIILSSLALLLVPSPLHAVNDPITIPHEVDPKPSWRLVDTAQDPNPAKKGEDVTITWNLEASAGYHRDKYQQGDPTPEKELLSNWGITGHGEIDGGTQTFAVTTTAKARNGDVNFWDWQAAWYVDPCNSDGSHSPGESGPSAKHKFILTPADPNDPDPDVDDPNNPDGPGPFDPSDPTKKDPDDTGNPNNPPFVPAERPDQGEAALTYEIIDPTSIVAVPYRGNVPTRSNKYVVIAKTDPAAIDIVGAKDVSLEVTHRIVTINSPDPRDLEGVLKLEVIPESAANDYVVFHVDPTTGAKQQITLPFQMAVTEPGHVGGGVHDFHAGYENFSFRRTGNGELHLKASVVPVKGASFKTAFFHLFPGEVKEVWSNQIANVEANGYPNKTGPSEYPFILIGATSGSNFKVKIKLVSEVSAANRSRTLFRWVSEGVFGVFIPEVGTSTFSDSKTVELNSNFNPQNGRERYLAMAFDANSNGLMDNSETVLLQTPHIQNKVSTSIPYKFIPVSKTDYDEKKSELLGWATSTGILFEDGARHLTAFCNGTVPVHASGSEPTTIMRNEPGLSHPVGVAFTPTSNPGASFKVLIDSAHELSSKLVESIAMKVWLHHEFDLINDFIRREIVQARIAGLTKLRFEVPADIKSMSFYPGDPDLLVCLGKVKFIEPIIRFDVDMNGGVSNVGIFGSAEDLYDFDYNAGYISQGGFLARPAAMLQAGYPSLGTGGKVFKTKIDLGGHNPYENPDVTPYNFY